LPRFVPKKQGQEKRRVGKNRTPDFAQWSRIGGPDKRITF
jgi:hypothetical protein